MIIFNFMAVPVVGLIIIIGMVMENVMPALMHGRYAGGVMSLVTLAVGVVSDLFGWRGRLFFVPIWLIGAGWLGFSLFSLYGWLGPVGVVPVFGLALVGLLKKADAMEAEAWAKAQRRVELLQDLASDPDRSVFWGCVKDCLVLPLGLKYTPEIAAHQVRVIGFILAASDSHFTEAERQSLQRLELILRDVERDPTRGDVPLPPRNEVTQAMRKIYATFRV